MLDSAINQYPNDFKDFDRTKNVQAQLQDMMSEYDLTKGASCFALFSNFSDFVVRWNGIYGNTPEQLWLAFVMKELYKKTWDNEKQEWRN